MCWGWDSLERETRSLPQMWAFVCGGLESEEREHKKFSDISSPLAGPLRLTMRKTSFLVWSHFRPSWVTHPPSSWRPLAFLYTPPVDMSLVATSNKDQRLRPPPGKGRFPIFSDDAKAMRETFFSRPFLGSSTHGRKGCGLGKRGGLRGQMTWRICGLGSLPQVTSLIRSVGSERRQKSRVEKRGLKGCWWRFWIFLHCV